MKKYNEALVIIDMQSYFPTARHKATINNVRTLIREYKKKILPIIVLEYYQPDENLGHTLPSLAKLLNDYYLTRYVRKTDNDGGDEVMEILDENCWEIEKFKVCGVNIGACVKETVYTLVHNYEIKVEVVKKACNGSCSRKGSFERNSSFYKNTRNLAVV